MTCDSACGDGRTAPGANAVVETDGMAILPGFQSLVSDDDVGGLDECELEVLVGFFGKMAIADLPARSGDFWGGAAIGGEGIRMGESGDIPDLTINDDGKDIPNTGKGFQQPDSRGLLDALADTVFE